MVANRVIVSTDGKTTSIQNKEQERLLETVALGALGGVVSSGVSAILGSGLTGGLASLMSLGSLAGGLGGAAASTFSGILDTDLSKIAGLKTMNKKDFLDTLESLETD